MTGQVARNRAFARTRRPVNGNNDFPGDRTLPLDRFRGTHPRFFDPVLPEYPAASAGLRPEPDTGRVSLRALVAVRVPAEAVLDAPDRTGAGLPEAGRPEAGRAEAGRAEVGRAELGRADEGRADAGLADDGRPEAGRAEPQFVRAEAGLALRDAE